MRLPLLMPACLLLGTATAGGTQSPAPPAAPPARPGPSVGAVALRAAGGATLGALGAGGLGLAVDRVWCERRHGDEPAFIFGPCFLYTGAGATAGWLAGSVAGAAALAARGARQRGCPRGAAWRRALGGAALGTLPGVLLAARPLRRAPTVQAAAGGGAPLLAAVGATAAVAGCRRP